VGFGGAGINPSEHPWQRQRRASRTAIEAPGQLFGSLGPETGPTLGPTVLVWISLPNQFLASNPGGQARKQREHRDVVGVGKLPLNLYVTAATISSPSAGSGLAALGSSSPKSSRGLRRTSGWRLLEIPYRQDA